MVVMCKTEQHTICSWYTAILITFIVNDLCALWPHLPFETWSFRFPHLYAALLLSAPVHQLNNFIQTTKSCRFLYSWRVRFTNSTVRSRASKARRSEDLQWFSGNYITKLGFQLTLCYSFEMTLWWCLRFSFKMCETSQKILQPISLSTIPVISPWSL